MKYEIKIPKPCSSKWSEMTPTEKGAFCFNCQKEVIDFTGKSHYQLALLLDSEHKMCGKFLPTQLNKSISSAQNHRFPKTGLLMGITTLLSLSTPAFSQSEPTESRKIEQRNTIGEETLVPGNTSDSVQIKGNVFDESGGLPGASIRIKGTSYRAETDFDGNFSIPISTKELGKNPTLVFSYIGFETQEIKVTSQTGFLKVNMLEDPAILGEVVIMKKQNIFRRIGNLFRKKENRSCH
ncbi:CarboxypepD_reg-like domain-containing protein [Zobellia uliginosa]|uniref:CarboxypepD_reg-like domain-containing protein n=2 Tax=Zobellia uliginosa TaxID=143224 RepID=A0ABY1KWA9_9FLAO|nr:CarboxypepD_reg-like domain-containing protein [Zobellia uliginosa]